MRRLMVGAAVVLVAMAALAASPAQARYFRHFGFGFPVVYAPPPVLPVYVPPPVYAVYAPPPVVYPYGYRVYHAYRRVIYRHAVHHIVHHRWCGCSCCR